MLRSRSTEHPSFSAASVVDEKRSQRGQTKLQRRGLYSSLLENAVFPAGDLLLRTGVIRKLREYRRTQWYSRERLDELQSLRLRALLGHAVRNVPFYAAIGFDERGDPREEIEKFPIMDKRSVKANLDGLICGSPSRLIESRSSGSSGIQGSIYYDRNELAVERAILLLWWEWAGYELGKPIVQSGITPRRGVVKKFKDVLLRTDYCSAFGLGEDQILEKLAEIRLKRGRVRHFMGYASSLYLFAQIARENHIGDIRFDSVVSWGDKMFPHYRDLIEEQFQTKVYDNYGCSEGCMIAAECAFSNLHIMTPQIHLEVLDDEGKEVATGRLGSVVVTRLDNYSMPLIRYRLGDIVGLEPPGKACECGRGLPLLQKLIGRDTDIVRTRSGKHMIVHFFTGIFEHYPEIRQFRVIQRSLDEIEIEYRPGDGFSVDIVQRIHQKIEFFLQEDFPVTFRQVEEIPPSSSGKPQIITSMLS